MDPLVAKMCGRYCKNSFIITRNEESRTVLRELGVPTELGTDTAWTFEPRPAEYGQGILRQAGWDGRTPVLVVCPINPFEWPVKASVAKYAPARPDRRIQREPLPISLFSQLRSRGRSRVSSIT